MYDNETFEKLENMSIKEQFAEYVKYLAGLNLGPDDELPIFVPYIKLQIGRPFTEDK